MTVELPSAAWALAATAVLAVPPVRGRAQVARPAPGSASGSAPGAVPGAVPRAGVLAGLATGLAAVALVVSLGAGRAAVPVLVACPLLWAVLRWALGRPERAARDPTLPLVLDLVAAALRSGRPLADSLVLAAPAARAPTTSALLTVSGLLRLGADPAQAWSVLDPGGPLAVLAPVAVRSAASGIKLAASFEQLGTQLRAEHAAATAARAHRAGVSAMGPLAACFLPSFVCLGVVPVVVGIARTALR